MSIRRKKKTQHFTQINNSAALNVNLSLKAKGLLLVMMTRPEDWVFYMEWLQKQSKDGREAHQNALKELESYRYVIRLRVQRPNGTFKGWEYLVDDEPITDVEPGGTVIREDDEEEVQPTNGKPVYRLPEPCATDERENRQSGKPIIGKPAATNTDLTKTENKKIVVEGGTEIQPAEPGKARSAQADSLAGVSNNNKNQAEPETAPPVGGSADADIMGEEIEFLFETNHQVAMSGNGTETENVPPAAPPAPAAAQEAQEAPAAFVPGAESRAEVTGLLSARLGGKSRLKTLLSEPGRDNVRQKASWLDLEPARVRAIVEEAQAKCAAEGVTYVTAITRRLDAALGARDASSLAERPASAGTTPGTLGAAYEVKPSVVVAELTGQASPPEEGEQPRKFVPGAEWRRTDGQIVTIEGREGARYLLSDGQKLLAFELMKAYEWIEVV